MIFVPTRRLVVLAFVATAMALISGLLRGVDATWIALDVVIVLTCAVDAFAGRARRVDAERHAGEIFSIGRANAVTLTLSSHSRISFSSSSPFAMTAHCRSSSARTSGSSRS